jgi:hypothetical protein
MSDIRVGGVGEVVTATATATAANAVPTLDSGAQPKRIMVQQLDGTTNFACIKFGGNAVAATTNDLPVPLNGVPLILDIRGYVHTDGVPYYSAIRRNSTDVPLMVTPLDG